MAVAVSFRTLLPPNATAWERSNEAVSGPRMEGLPVSAIRQARDPEACATVFLAGLAWERSVHFWDPGDAAGNRARVASSWTDHLVYGAPAALEAEIALDTGLTIAVREFFEVPGLVWPEFVADAVVDPGDAAPDMTAVIASALARKPVRDVLARARVFAVQQPASVLVSAATFASPKVVVLPLGGAPPLPQVLVGAASRVIEIATVYPLKAA